MAMQRINRPAGGRRVNKGPCHVAFEEAVQAELDSMPVKDRGRAVSNVVHKHPELHEAMIAEVNGGR